MRIYGLQICGLNNKGNLVCILVYKGVMVYNLKVGYVLASGVSFKAAWVYKTNLVKYIRYKASDLIEFRKSKEFVFGIDLV